MTLRDKIVEAVWERLAADVATGRGMLKSSVLEAVAGVLALQGAEDGGQKTPVKTLGDVTPELTPAERIHAEWMDAFINEEARRRDRIRASQYMDAVMYGLGAGRLVYDGGRLDAYYAPTKTLYSGS